MGFLDIIFGESPSTETQVLDTLTSEQEAALNELLRELQGPSPEFGGSVSVEASELQQLSLEALQERAKVLGDPNRESTLAASAADTVLKFLDFDAQDATLEDFFNTNIRDPAIEDFQENVLPQISRDFGGANFFSSERQEADQNAQEEIIEALTRSRSDLAFNDRQANRDRAVDALGIVPALENLDRGDTLEILDLLAAGESDTALTERNIGREFERFLANQEVAASRRGQTLGAINTGAFENVVTSNPGSSGFLADFISAFNGDIIFKDTPSTKIGGNKDFGTSKG